MAQNFSINLLPVEFITEEAKKNKFYKLQALGIALVLFMIFLSILTISLRIFQSNTIKSAQVTAANAEGKVSAQADKQAQLVLLKNRLNAIDQYLGTSSKQVEMYNLLDSLIPSSFTVNTISVGVDGKILISAVTFDPFALDSMFSAFLDKEKNEGKISKVAIENISRGRDGIFRVSFSVEATK